MNGTDLVCLYNFQKRKKKEEDYKRKEYTYQSEEETLQNKKAIWYKIGVP